MGWHPSYKTFYNCRTMFVLLLLPMHDSEKFMNENKLLLNCPLFTGLTDDECRQVTAVTQRREYGKDELVFSRGDGPRCVYILVSGMLRIFSIDLEGKEQFIAIVCDPGLYFGEGQVLNDFTHATYSQTLDDTTLFTIDKADFISLFYKFPKIAQNIALHSTRQLRDLGVYLSKFNNSDIEKRLLQLLLRLAASKSNYLSSADIIHSDVTTEALALLNNQVIDFSQDKLADIIGATRPSVYKSLKKFQEMGAIELQYGKIKIIDAGIFITRSLLNS